MTDRELLQQALDALESWQKTCLDCGRSSEELGRATKSLQAIRTALAQPEPEPVAKVFLTEKLSLPCLRWLDLTRQFDFKGGELLYTAPPKKEWVGLTDDQRIEIAWGTDTNLEYAIAIEAELKRTNA